jgi:hypothetical protein
MLLVREEQVLVRNRDYFDILMIIILASLTGFRSTGGSDFDLYQTAYNSIPPFGDFLLDSSYFSDKWERGYLYFISFIKTFSGLSFYGYLVLQSAVIYTLMYKGLKKYTDHWGLFMLLFMYKMVFYETFVSMRQPLTIVFFYMIMHLIEEKKWIKYYLILTFLILPLHNGAYFLFLVYFVSFFKITKRRIIILNCLFIPLVIVPELGIDPLRSITNILLPHSDSIIQQKGEGYLDSSTTLSIIHTLEYLLVMSLLIINYDKIIKTHKYAPLVIKLFLILLPMMTLFRGTLIFRRELDYFVPTYAFILGYVCDIYKSKKWLVIFGTAIICLYGYLRYIYLFDDGGLIPYRSWLYIPDASFFNN